MFKEALRHVYYGFKLQSHYFQLGEIKGIVDKFREYWHCQWWWKSRIVFPLPFIFCPGRQPWKFPITSAWWKSLEQHWGTALRYQVLALAGLAQAAGALAFGLKGPMPGLQA